MGKKGGRDKEEEGGGGGTDPKKVRGMPRVKTGMFVPFVSMTRNSSANTAVTSIPPP